MNLTRDLAVAYQAGVKLAFAKFADPANNTMLSNPINPDTLQQHGYTERDLDSFVRPIEAEMQQIESQYEGEERQRRLEDLAERVYGDFAALPDSELEALSRGRGELEHDLATGTNRHTNTALQSSVLTRPRPVDEDEDEDTEFSEHPPVAHVPMLHNPAYGDDHSFTANVVTTGRPPFGSGNQHAQGYMGIPLFRYAPEALRFGPGVKPLEEDLPGRPPFINSPQEEYDARVSEGFKPHPGGMRGDLLQLGASHHMHPSGHGDGAEIVEDPFLYAHEMYHHKVNNIGRSHPALGRLKGFLRPGDNEMFADYYAAQAPRTGDTDARFSRTLSQTGQYAAEESPHFNNPEYPLQITPPVPPGSKPVPMHFKPSVRMGLPRVGPFTGSR